MGLSTNRQPDSIDVLRAGDHGGVVQTDRLGFAFVELHRFVYDGVYSFFDASLRLLDFGVVIAFLFFGYAILGRNEKDDEIKLGKFWALSSSPPLWN